VKCCNIITWENTLDVYSIKSRYQAEYPENLGNETLFSWNELPEQTVVKIFIDFEKELNSSLRWVQLSVFKMYVVVSDIDIHVF
jgi:hypothetical protein